MNDVHYHMHDEAGACYGDSMDFNHAILVAGEHTYPWCVVDNEPLDEILTIVEASFCIDMCREDDDES